MKFFGDESKASNVPVTASETVKPIEATKKKGELSKLIDESVIETALVMFKTAPNFFATVNGIRMPVGLLLPVDRIGGLDRKATRKDDSKGQMLECIRNDEIQIYASPSMLGNESFMFIPTQQTLTNMDEYAFLRNAEYDLASVDVMGEAYSLGSRISFVDAVRVNSGEVPLSAFLGKAFKGDDSDDDNVSLDIDLVDDDSDDDSSYEFTGGSNNPPAPKPSASASSGRDPVLKDDSESQFVDLESMTSPFDGDDGFDDDNDDETDIDYSDIPASEPTYDNSDNGPVADATDYDVDDDDEENPFDNGDFDAFDAQLTVGTGDDGEPVYSEDVAEEAIKNAISRRFYSDDIVLEVSTVPFDMQFMRGMPPLAFPEDYDDQWLSGYLCQMAKAGNAELAKLHYDNIERLRENYLNLVSRSCEDIQRALDLSTSDTRYGKKMRKLNELRDQHHKSIQSDVSSRKQELSNDYNERREQYANNAAATARQQFDNLYRRQHDAQLSQLEPAAYERLESEYQSSLRELLADRRDKASKMLDSEINSALQVVTNEYRKRLEEEQKVADRIKKEMRDFLDENRKEEITRINVLKEELERKTSVSEVVAEYTARMDALSKEFEAKKVSFESEIAELNRLHALDLDNKEKETERRLNEAHKITDEVRSMLTEANRRYYDLDVKKEEEYKARLEALQQDKQMLSERMSAIMDSNKSSNKVSSYLVIAITVAALCIGTIAGGFILNMYSKSQAGGNNNSNSNGNNDVNQSAIIEEYQKRMDELEKQYGYQVSTEEASPEVTE